MPSPALQPLTGSSTPEQPPESPLGDEEEDLIVASNPDISVSSRAALPDITTRPGLVNPTPRTPNRVRFALDDDSAEDAIELTGQADDGDNGSDGDDVVDEEDYAAAPSDDATGRAPLLTRLAAPSVVVANSLGASELLGTDRPKSGGLHAFMNMANSIIGAGIIGAHVSRLL